MSAEQKNSTEQENNCVVCCKTLEIYSYGICDHPVCFECSTRMRVLCKQNECPLCRQDLPKVIFTKSIEPFSSIFPRFERSNLQDRKLGLFFCTLDIQKAYWKLLEHRCSICDEYEEKKWPFRSFNQLKDHMRREHELFYCDLCSEHLKIFSFERRTYTRQELGLHRRKGDPDNTSHRGHPLCQFCDTRFMDADDLFRHLRRTHLFCHFCDADGKHQYYDNLEDLKRHFREEHFFCEEGECREVPMAAVFRTDIDFKGHIARAHSRGLSKSAGKQARTLDIEFTLAPRPRPETARGGNSRYQNNHRRDRLEEVEYNLEPGGPGGGVPEEPQYFNSLSSDNFPTLGNGPAPPLRNIATVNFTSKFNGLRGSEFPSLGGASSSGSRQPEVTITTNSAGGKNRNPPEVTITRTVRGQQNNAGGSGSSKDQFPALGAPAAGPTPGSSTVRLSMNNSKDSKVSIHVNQRPNGAAITTHITATSSKPTEAFPALSKSNPVHQPQWVSQKPKKQESKLAKVAHAPTLPPSDLAQFPSLSKPAKPKKTISVTMPVSGQWSQGNQSKNSNGAKNGNKSTLLNGNLSGDNNKTSNSSKTKQGQKYNEKFETLESKSKNKKKKSKASDSGESLDSKSNNNEPSSTNKNDATKKISELKIGTLNIAGESSQISNRPPPGINVNKPPGISVKPPPGFNSGNFPTLGSNNLTFTNSTGQSYAITPSCDSPNKDFKQPRNFQQRNQILFKKFCTVLNNNDAIKEFKKYSDLFRKNELPSVNYYDHCKEILGENFDEIFPELLVLLPDITKQQELYGAHNGKSKNSLTVCQNCSQVILKNELTEHYNYHKLDNHFPSLGKAQQVGNSAWGK